MAVLLGFLEILLSPIDENLHEMQSAARDPQAPNSLFLQQKLSFVYSYKATEKGKTSNLSSAIGTIVVVVDSFAHMGRFLQSCAQSWQPISSRLDNSPMGTIKRPISWRFRQMTAKVPPESIPILMDERLGYVKLALPKANQQRTRSCIRASQS
jgi:hypothetical protein